MKSIDASIDSGVVTLRGSVATESDKRIVERVLMLEPGVDSVKNEIVVRSKPGEQVEPQRIR
jgi:osmotically-inducible protein OsmY